MSPLTKILVILVVLLALVQTAATVVFVSRVDVASLDVKTRQEQLQANEAQIASLRAELANAQAAVNTVRQQAQNQVASVQSQLLTLQQQLADANVKIAETNSRNQLMSVDNTRLTETLKASEDTKNKLADTVTQTRQINDELARKNADLVAANADLQNRLEVTERDRRYLREQVTELQGRGTGSSSADAGSPGSMNNAAPAAGRGTPAINATVRKISTIANIPYATISAGTADRVAPGMKFTVLDAQGNFLGFVEITTTEANESVGRLSGPRVPDIKAGDQASTQLQ